MNPEPLPPANRGRLDARGWTGLAILALVVVAAVFAPWLSPADPGLQDNVVATRFIPPFHEDGSGTLHLLGTDRFGRDVWSRVLYGARISLLVGVLAMGLSVTIGMTIGLVAGVFRRRADTLLMGFTDFALALPRVVLLLLLTALWEPSAGLVIVVLGVTGWMSIARLVYGEARGVIARPFVESAFAMGAHRPRILVRHVLPNTLTPVFSAVALGVGNTIMLEAGLSFLGLGVQPPTPSWGNMIASGRDTLVNAPWVAAAPGVLLVLVVIAFTLLGDSLRDRMMGGETG